MLGKGSGSYCRHWSKLYPEEESRIQSNGLKYASRLPISYRLYNLLSSPAHQYPTANPARLGQVLPPTFEAERHRSGGPFGLSMG